ncbi:MAG: hypothetical protein M0T70_14615 [Geobacteraceae bacterium]|nr:hypothetical protein [Geobacteraceae bacterium]
MKTILITLLAVYLLIGVLIYVLTDTSKFAGKVERMFAFLTYSDVIKYMFPFVLVLWPVWLYVNAKFNE